MDTNKGYVNFEDWFNEIEQHSMRSERFFSQLQALSVRDRKEREQFVMGWMEAAWEQGRLSMLWENA